MANNKQFTLDIKKFIKETTAKITFIRKKVAFDVFVRVINRTPVDQGYARGGWQCSLAAASTRSTKVKDTAAGMNPMSIASGPTVEKMALKVTKLSMRYPSIFLSNNVPYIDMLEDGLYSKESTTGKTINGFSSQAPSGMVKVTLEEFPYLFAVDAREGAGI